MNARSTLLQVIVGHISVHYAARQLFEACVEIIGQGELRAEQRAALRKYFGQPEDSDA
jgi:hypothetical protein